MVAEENGAAAGTATHRSEINQFIAQFTVVAEEDGTEMLDCVKPSHGDGRVELTVRRGKAEVERGSGVDAKSVNARNVNAFMGLALSISLSNSRVLSKRPFMNISRLIL